MRGGRFALFHTGVVGIIRCECHDVAMGDLRAKVRRIETHTAIVLTPSIISVLVFFMRTAARTFLERSIAKLR